MINKKLHWVGGLIIGLLALAWILLDLFPDFQPRFLMSGLGPPPENHEERKAWLSENVDNMNHKDFVTIDYQVPSWKELDKLNASLSKTRNYPEYIKATQTYGTLPNLIEVLYFGDVLKDMGANTQFVHANYWMKNKGDELKLWYLAYDRPRDLSQDEAKRALVHNILLAREQGLAVVLFGDYVQLEDGGMDKFGVSDDLESRIETITLSLAEIAEEYNVEYLVVVNQIEMILATNNYSIEEAQVRTNAFYANVVPKIREIYSGKVVYKLGGFNDWDNYDAISLEGADLFGFTGCYNRRRDKLDFMTSDIKELSTKATKLSKQYGVPWILAEFVVSNDEQFQSDSFSEKPTGDIPIEEYYKQGLATFNRHGYSATGFTVHSLLGAGKIYDTPAMPMMTEFFNSKN